MKREIKFRIWDTSLGMEYEPIIGGNKPVKINYALNNPEGLTEPCKVMQYTGLKEKNGKEIYESDVLGCDEGNVVIEFTGGQFVGINTDKDHPIRETQNRNWFQWELIGNIHENPELLNK